MKNSEFQNISVQSAVAGCKTTDFRRKSPAGRCAEGAAAAAGGDCPVSEAIVPRRRGTVRAEEAMRGRASECGGFRGGDAAGGCLPFKAGKCGIRTPRGPAAPGGGPILAKRSSADAPQAAARMPLRRQESGFSCRRVPSPSPFSQAGARFSANESRPQSGWGCGRLAARGSRLVRRGMPRLVALRAGVGLDDAALRRADELQQPVAVLALRYRALHLPRSRSGSSGRSGRGCGRRRGSRRCARA